MLSLTNGTNSSNSTDNWPFDTMDSLAILQRIDFGRLFARSKKIDVRCCFS
jgi:hypothetical protein